MNYLPRIRPNPLHDRLHSGRPHSTSLCNPRWGGGLYLAETRRHRRTVYGIGWRKQLRWTWHGTSGGGGAARCSAACLDLFQVQTSCPIRVSLRSPPSASNSQTKTRPHSSAINGQWTFKTANARYEHL